MKKVLVALSFALLSLTSYAQVPTPMWELVSIPDKRGNVVGHIYHTYAVGTLYDVQQVKAITGLRLVCPNNGVSPPIIAIFWNGQDASKVDNISIDIRIDRKIFPNIEEYRWSQEGPLTYRNLSDSTELIAAMRGGRTISFTWFGLDEKKRTTIFNISSFNLYLNDFAATCKN